MIMPEGILLKSISCGALRDENVGEAVTLSGWVHRRRDHGNLIFIDLRDREGLVQVVFNPETAAKAHKIAEDLRNEWVVQVMGEVTKRPAGTENPDMPTGIVEVYADDLKVLNQSLTPPFYVNEEVSVDENLRLRYRYVDLRRESMKEALLARHKVVKYLRDFLDDVGFLEIETPILIKSTPDGARDHVVPSRLYPGSFYALPQSPQQLKQLLMVGGIEKYFQIARCFRDEDSRADRQPEFTQLDIEMSFISEEEIISFNESLIKTIWKEVLNINFDNAFPRMPWQAAMDNYGTDRPDTRYKMLLKDLGEVLGDIGFNIFTKAIKSGGSIKSITVKGGNSSISNVRIKPGGDIFQVAQDAGAGGLAFIRVKGDELETIGAIKNNLREKHIADILRITEAQDGDLILLGAGDKQIVNQIGRAHV